VKLFGHHGQLFTFSALLSLNMKEETLGIGLSMQQQQP